MDTGFDLDHNGKTGDAADAHGFGDFPGQYGMVVLSRYPIDTAASRTFRKFLWKDMPNNNMPQMSDGKPWYSKEAQDVLLRLSSKNHWDVPIRLGKKILHVLASHPTPPVLMGPRIATVVAIMTRFVSGPTISDPLTRRVIFATTLGIVGAWVPNKAR
ncbi:MAG: endonuclease/exonuclease/phosphatase family protein [Myxococcota bacterium]